uniref:Uncharacterized protein n=1 Tax=Ditylenchus dipsaci TaxID=166011 RepID=A0A915CQN9_9BILA
MSYWDEPSNYESDQSKPGKKGGTSSGPDSYASWLARHNSEDNLMNDFSISAQEARRQQSVKSIESITVEKQGG